MNSSPIEKARKLVRSFPDLANKLEKLEAEGTYYNGKASVYFGDDEKVTPTLLAECLSYYIDIDEQELPEEKIPLGRSKMKGLPHLPPSLEWPKKHYFYAQLNIADFKKYDIENVFPDSGMIYIFDNASDDFTVLYYDGPMDVLHPVPYPPAKNLPEPEYFLEEYRDSTSLLSFSPRFIFYVAGDAYDYRAVTAALPADLVKELESILSAKISDWNPSLRIFGRPLFWQGEDEEGFGEGFGEDFDDEDEGDDDGENDGESDTEVDEEDDESDGVAEDRSILMFHDEYGEGNIHIFIGAKDLRQGKLSEAYVSYSGT